MSGLLPTEATRPYRSYHLSFGVGQQSQLIVADVANTPWDLVVIDEAHRLRNVYKPANVIANTLKRALEDRPKLLLTATSWNPGPLPALAGTQ
jgi:hypothetical protein